MESLIQKLRAHTGMLTISEVAELLGFHPVSLRNWVRAGKLPAVRIAGQWRFDPAELAGGGKKHGAEVHHHGASSPNNGCKC